MEQRAAGPDPWNRVAATFTPRTLAVSTLLPPWYPSYCRILHPAYDGARRLRWPQSTRGLSGGWESFSARVGFEANTAGAPDISFPLVGSLDSAHLCHLVFALEATTAPDTFCPVAVWEGAGEIRRELADEPRVRLPGRDCVTSTARLDEVVLRPWAPPDSLLPAPAALWFDPDLAWAVATDIDLDYTLVGGEESLIDALLTHDVLECVPTSIDGPLG